MKRLWEKLKAIAATDQPEHLRRGKLGERAARQHLQAQGLKFLTANYRSPRGEIDLVFRTADCLDTFPTHATNNTQRDLVA
ncbi:MAG: hypothetical protein RLZZ265_3370 [Verrucomicrobiota bacterium]|jgi:Holliday junction resolvase-like predicted endonuclease